MLEGRFEEDKTIVDRTKYVYYISIICRLSTKTHCL